MIDKKDKLFNKIIKKDYNNLLEELLGIKGFEENVKSLLLSMCYKIENAYGDYEKTKRNVLSKEEYMKRIFLIIQKQCENIEFIKKDDKSKNIEYIIDKEKKKISCYPIEMDLLYCLTHLDKKDNIIKGDNNVINKVINILLNEGNSINFCEPLRDFNGFSWNVVSKDIQNIIYNLTYQDLIFITGSIFLEEWVNFNNFVIDYFEKLKDDLAERYGEVLSKKITTNIVKIAILEYFIKNEDCQKEIKNEKIKIEHVYEKYSDSSKYIEEIGNKKKQLAKKIKQIDQTINDKELLDNEYKKRNENLPLEKKIFSMKVLKKMMQDERKEYIEKLEEYALLMNPQVFLKRNEKIKEYMTYFEIIDASNFQKVLFSEIIDLQKNVLEIFKIKINTASDKQEIIKIIYELRYFCQIPISKEKKIFQEQKLINDIEKVQKLILQRAIEKKVIIQISNIDNINFKILKNIFYSTIMSLENIDLKIYKEDNDWKIQFYDENIEDKIIDIEELIDKKDIRVKINKNVKLFI